MAAASQDLIGWTEFLHSKVLVEIATTQWTHCGLSPLCRLTGDNWMKAFVSQLLQICHSQWIFRNYTLYDKQRGFLCLWEHLEVLQEVHRLLDMALVDISEESQYLLELGHDISRL